MQERLGKSIGLSQTGNVFLGIGANLPGRWGPPHATLRRCLGELTTTGIGVVASSSLYASTAMGPVAQPAYLNCVVGVRTSLAPLVLLAVIKRIERRAGRSSGRRWGPRPLDIDILDYKGVLRTATAEKGFGALSQLALPHPGLAKRIFVLAPFAEIAPGWHHPVSGLTARALIARLSPSECRIARCTD